VIIPGAKGAKEESKEGGQNKKAMGKGWFSIESIEVGGKKAFICVFRNLIGKDLYTASIVNKLSRKRRIEEKAMKLQLKVALIAKDEFTKKPRVEHSVISFARKDDIAQFEKDWDSAIEELAK
jgi:hypothetical protein